MFERINRDDLSKPKGTRPAGYIWNEELLGWRRTEAQTMVDEARLAAQAQARQQPARAKGAKALPFGPNVPDCTWIEYSFFDSACGHHVPLVWFDLLTGAFASAVGTCGGSSATNPNPKVRKSGAVAKAVLASMVLEEGSIRAARGDSRDIRRIKETSAARDAGFAVYSSFLPCTIKLPSCIFTA